MVHELRSYHLHVVADFPEVTYRFVQQVCLQARWADALLSPQQQHQSADGELAYHLTVKLCFGR